MDRLLSRHRCQCSSLRSVGVWLVVVFRPTTAAHSRIVRCTGGMQGGECDRIKSHKDGATKKQPEKVLIMRASGGRGRGWSNEINSARESRSRVQRQVTPSRSCKFDDEGGGEKSSAVNGKNSHINIHLIMLERKMSCAPNIYCIHSGPVWWDTCLIEWREFGPRLISLDAAR